MPRHTRPPARAKHGRAHIRYQRNRWAKKRFQRARAMYHDSYNLVRSREINQLGYYGEKILPQKIDAKDATDSPKEHLDMYPFNHYWNQWADNWQTHCSCGLCAGPKTSERSREKREWQKEWAGSLESSYL